MANIKFLNNDYVKFYLESKTYGKVLMEYEPGGWDDDNLELDRSDQHGIFNKFSNSLKFYKNYKDIIENTFKIEGNNSSLYLIKEELLDQGDKIKFVEIYRGRADWETKKIKEETLEIRFNSNELEDLIKANEDDEFQLDRNKSIDEVILDELKINKTKLEGRALSSESHSTIIDEDLNQVISINALSNAEWSTFIKTKIIKSGIDRHSSVDIYNFDSISASTMFFVDSVAIEEEQLLSLNIKLDFDYYYEYALTQLGDYLTEKKFSVELLKIKRFYQDENDTIGEYQIESLYTLFEDNDGPSGSFAGSTGWRTCVLEWDTNINLEWNEGLALRFNAPLRKSPDFTGFVLTLNHGYKVREYDIKFNATSFVESSLDISFMFTHDVYSRLLGIIANNENLFYSKYFGRKELGYSEDGEGGLIGITNGYWIRAFNEISDKYKSIQISFKDLLDSTNSMFNIGMGTQNLKGKKIVRVEDVKYFYQSRIIVHLGQANEVERNYDKDLYFSSLEFGQNKGGDYENETGLDEPNLRINYTTPDRKSTNRYSKISKIRSDETGMEIIRRKPEINFPDTDTGSDEHNWFLDIKRVGFGYTQKDWRDRLEVPPEGINNPSTYRAFYFTPFRMMLRHGWIIRSGLQPYLNKKINFASSKLNSNLKTHYIGDDTPYEESLPNGIEVGVLDRPRLLPEKITFRAKLTKEVLNKIYSTTRVFYKGSWENIPNYYFRFSWINENGEKESGYLINMKPENLGKFTMQKANEN